jgi:hypothetical protein
MRERKTELTNKKAKYLKEKLYGSIPNNKKTIDT